MKSKKINSIFARDERIALSSDQVKNIFNKYTGESVNILQTNAMDNINNMNDIVNEEMPYTILFDPVNSATSGHYQALFLYKNRYYFFDSYGHSYTMLYNKVNKIQGYEAFNNSDKIGKMLYYSGRDVIQNTYPYQNIKDDFDNTCGRHSVCVLIYFIQNIKKGNHYDFNVYYDNITEYKRIHKLPTYDDCVIQITNRFIK